MQKGTTSEDLLMCALAWSSAVKLCGYSWLSLLGKQSAVGIMPAKVPFILKRCLDKSSEELLSVLCNKDGKVYSLQA